MKRAAKWLFSGFVENRDFEGKRKGDSSDKTHSPHAVGKARLILVQDGPCRFLHTFLRVRFDTPLAATVRSPCDHSGEITPAESDAALSRRRQEVKGQMSGQMNGGEFRRMVAQGPEWWFGDHDAANVHDGQPA
jgi:hypothetical protein